MFPELSFTSTTLIWSFTGLATMLIALIYGGRLILSRRGSSLLAQTTSRKSIEHIGSRAKYPQVDINKWYSTLMGGSLALVMAAVVIAFNWTSESVSNLDTGIVYSLDADIEIAPPQTTAPRPPPTPPPQKKKIKKIKTK